MKENMEPYQALQVPEILAHIFSFLSGRSQVKTRLVSRIWNNVILANFHKNLRFKLTHSKEYKNFVLNNVDPMMLSSVSVMFSYNNSICEDEQLQRTLCHPHLRNNFAELRNLSIACIHDARTIYSFLQLVDGSCFPKLEILKLYFSLKLKEIEEKTVFLAVPGSLRGLKQLVIHHYNEFDAVEKFKAGPVPAAIQSLVAAAPNLKSLESNMFLDLAGRRVKKLILRGSKLLEDEEEARIMLSSVKESLTSLDLFSVYPDFHLLPEFPKLTNLHQYEDRFRYRAPLEREFRASTFPVLKSLLMQFRWINWDEFPSAGNMEDIVLLNVPPPYFGNVEAFRLIFNANAIVTKLRINFVPYCCIENLLSFLEKLYIEEREVNSTSSELELYGLGEKVGIEHTKESQLRYFSAILDKLGRRWCRVKFPSFEFNETPKWIDAEVPLLSGFKTCLIKKKKSGYGAVRPQWDISCEIRK